MKNAPPAEIWIVWAEDSHALDHCTDATTAQAAAIEHHQEAEEPGYDPEYSWIERDGHLELRADDVDTGIRVSRAPVRGPAAPADRTAALTEAERTMLTYALDQAQEHIWSRDGFTDDDQAAVTSLRRMADEAQQNGPKP
ncbi:hypothetical protein [Streptomyces sp. NPDC017941]|uniref:hypothetical protein n=1 Tax=Streptomyces sp. NPDC017941 TaxID=3365018 RepID=UPI00378EA0FE